MAALYTSSLAAGFSLEPEDNYTDSRRDGGRRTGGTRRRRRQRDSSEEDEGETTATQGRGPNDTTTGTGTASESGTILSDDEENDTEDEIGVGGRDERERASRLSLLARDVQERNEQRRSQQERDLREGRRMTNVDLDPLDLERYEMERTLDSRRERELNRELGQGEPTTPIASGSGSTPLSEREREIEMPSATRVLGRLDEETEEETEAGGSRRSSIAGGNGGELDQNWEEIGVSSPALAESMRRRRNAPTNTSENKPTGGESTVGGSSTSRASSVRSFGATTSYGGSTTTSSTATAGPSGTTHAPSVQEQIEEGDEADVELDRESSNTGGDDTTPSENTGSTGE